MRNSQPVFQFQLRCTIFDPAVIAVESDVVSAFRAGFDKESSIFVLPAYVLFNKFGHVKFMVATVRNITTLDGNCCIGCATLSNIVQVIPVSAGICPRGVKVPAVPGNVVGVPGFRPVNFDNCVLGPLRSFRVVPDKGKIATFDIFSIFSIS